MSEEVPMSKVREDMGLPPATKPRQKTDDEIKELVLDVFNGNVFADFMIPNEAGPSGVAMVFMPLALMEEEDGKKLMEEDEASMIYEYMDKAGPRSVNGMPGFFSFKFLNRADHDYFADQMEKYIKLQNEFMGVKDDGRDRTDDDADMAGESASPPQGGEGGPRDQGAGDSTDED